MSSAELSLVKLNASVSTVGAFSKAVQQLKQNPMDHMHKLCCFQYLQPVQDVRHLNVHHLAFLVCKTPDS